MITKRESDYIDAYDTLTARLAQALGLLAALNTIYGRMNGDGVRHDLNPGRLRDALWGITDLLEQADTAALVGLGGCKFVEKAERKCS
jgi:hypothetical protein